MSFEKSYQLCWRCKKAIGGCSWSKKLKPVKGWIADYCPIKIDKNETMPSYKVYYCPLFEEGK